MGARQSSTESSSLSFCVSSHVKEEKEGILFENPASFSLLSPSCFNHDSSSPHSLTTSEREFSNCGIEQSNDDTNPFVILVDMLKNEIETLSIENSDLEGKLFSTQLELQNSKLSMANMTTNGTKEKEILERLNFLSTSLSTIQKQLVVSKLSYKMKMKEFKFKFNLKDDEINNLKRELENLQKKYQFEVVIIRSLHDH